ncbi:MAG: GNAT family N-acetyltransferase [Acidobacteriota bacterium]|nr:GNAT family N-acetyltransferase [Acidobacteriota bacterium]
MKLRRADAGDVQWINAAYEAIRFQQSDLARELLIVAEVDDQRAGIGRLVPAGQDACELGGMLVFDAFRGRGVARAIIEELLRHANGKTVYCIPFADLVPIYEKAGFRIVDEDASLPEYVRKKLDWCRREIDRDVVLMRLTI